MTRTRRAATGALTTYAHQILVTLVGLWLTRFLLQQIGQAEYGLWLIATAVLGYLGLTDRGVVARPPA